MTTTINASPTNGLVQTADGSGVLKVQSNGVTTNALAWGSYAWVGAGSTPTLRSSYNISSITRSSTGTFVLAFTNATSDANYGVATSVNEGATTNTSGLAFPIARSTSSVTIEVGYVASTGGTLTVYDMGFDFIIFGN